MVQRTRKGKAIVHGGSQAFRAARETESDGAGAMGADSGIVRTKHMRKPVMAILIVTPAAVDRIGKHLRYVAYEIRVAPAMMQRFVLQVLVTDLFADRQQFFADDFRPVEALVASCVEIQSPRGLEQLRAGIGFFGKRSCLFECRRGL